jgi:hypothetical protein
LAPGDLVCIDVNGVGRLANLVEQAKSS